MAGVFLTEGHRLQPRNKRRVSPNHPWGKGLQLRSGIAMPNGATDPDIQTNHIPNTVGCYHTSSKPFDQ